jgi:DEAD/DEAH box helicase domain-containing protein
VDNGLPGGRLLQHGEQLVAAFHGQSERPRIQLEGEALALPDPRCGHIRFGPKGSVFYHSSGEHEKGYAVCLHCGRAESMVADGELPPALRPGKDHRPVGSAAGSHKEKDCPGSGVKPNINLGYQTQTDVLELFLRSPKTGQWLSDSPEHQVIAMTFAVALRDVIAVAWGLEVAYEVFGSTQGQGQENATPHPSKGAGRKGGASNG